MPVALSLVASSLSGMSSIEAVFAAHRARIHAIDEHADVPDVALDDVARVIEVEDDQGAGVAVIRRIEVDPATQMAMWSAPRPWAIGLRLHGDRIGDLASRLLERVDDYLIDNAPRGNPNHAALVRIAARDVDLVRPLLRHGYAAGTVTALRTVSPDSDAPFEPGAAIRQARQEDRETLIALATALQKFDASFGTLGEPNELRPLIETLVDSMLEPDSTLLLVAETGEGIVGYASIADPESSDWITSSTTLAPAAYLGQAYISPAARGSGAGTALTRRLHAEAAERGWNGILLDYAAPNPLSGPFWSRHGYRPLHVTWQRRPAHPSLGRGGRVR